MYVILCKVTFYNGCQMLSSGDQSFDGDQGKAICQIQLNTMYSCNGVLLLNSFYCVSVCGRHTLGKEENRGYKLKVQGFFSQCTLFHNFLSCLLHEKGN